MGEVKPRILPNGSVFYPNPMAKLAVAMVPLGVLFGSAIGMPLFLRVYKPIAVLYCGLPIILAISVVMLYLLSKMIVLGVEAGPDYVVLGYTLRKRRILPNEVKRITIDPPVYSDSLEYQYWGVMDSVCHIDLVDGTRLVVSFMPNGMKLRMARVLDPQNYPPAE